jgi:hypothetical protein
MQYYACECDTFRAVWGPATNTEVRIFINSQDDDVRDRLCNFSRDMLDSMGVYPKNRVGEIALKYDLKHSWVGR